MKPFSKWTIEEVEDEFHVVLHKQSDLLEKWMAPRSQPSKEEEKVLSELSETLQDRVWDWNEDELKICFIARLLHLADFEHGDYRPFFSREISAVHNEEKLSGTVDFMVAWGKRSPKRPLFFINEHKKEHDSSGDPLGQLMIAMVAAQKVNNDDNPVYGAYVMGRYWHFTVLHGLSYAVHTGLNAADEGIRQIFGVLRNVREIIEDLIGLKDRREIVAKAGEPKRETERDKSHE